MKIAFIAFFHLYKRILSQQMIVGDNRQGFCYCLNMQFSKDTHTMRFDSIYRDIKILGYFLIGHTHFCTMKYSFLYTTQRY